MQQIAVVTLAIGDIARSRQFYADGFGWEPVFANAEILFYQMNGFVLGLWSGERLAEDAGLPVQPSGGFALAHNLESREAVDAQMDRLVAAGARLLRAADAPLHGGYRGYVADPDGHAWEVAWNPAWPIDAEGRVTYAA